MTKHSLELFVIKIEIIAQRHSDCRSSRRKRGFARSFGEFIPWARVETIVATENVIADERPQFERNGSFQFDCEIRNATPRIEPMGRRNRACRTCGNAALAGSAAIALRRVPRRPYARQKFLRGKKNSAIFF